MKVVLYEKLLAATGKNIWMDVAVLKELPQAVCSQRRCSEIVDALNLPCLSGLSELKSYEHEDVIDLGALAVEVVGGGCMTHRTEGCLKKRDDVIGTAVYCLLLA